MGITVTLKEEINNFKEIYKNKNKQQKEQVKELFIFPKVEIESLRKTQMERILKIKHLATQKGSSEESFTGRKKKWKIEFQTLEIPQN